MDVSTWIRLSCLMTYFEDPPRVVLIVCNTAIAQSSLSHDSRVQARIGEGGTAAGNEAADSRISSVLLLDFTSSAVTQKQKQASSNRPNSYDTDNDTSSDASFARAS